ncbi:MAG: BamA/TamA family outer membrane protein, partial [Candidatus Cloacimonetes bacterium]|nr:BamA/TamA family outer membrane protein [Candidatus Cloacimonadota bacterium]
LREEVDSSYIHTAFDTDLYYYTLYNQYGIFGGVDDYHPGSRRPRVIEKSSYKKAGLSWRFNNEDYQPNPTRGSEINIRHWWIFRDYDGEMQTKRATTISMQHHQRLYRQWVVSLLATAKTIDRKHLESYEQFQMGGNESLRGFMENQFQGHRLGWTSLELRYLLSRYSRFFLFGDYGYVEFEQNDNLIRIDALMGYGLGVRLQTRIGQLKLDYALSYNEGEWRKPMDGIVHFGIETRF